MENESTTRRKFIVKSTAALAGITVGLNAFSSGQTERIIGANDKIRMGFIGIGNRGSQLLQLFMGNPDVEVAALCDIYEPYLHRDRSSVDQRFINAMPGQVPKMEEKFGKDPKRYSDFRMLLGDKNIDAVCIATPDHWHAIQCISALEAGKDVYVEKPLTIALGEGRAMVDVQKRTGRVVQVGLNRRGNVVYQKLAGDIPAGKIGRVISANAFRISNMFPEGIGKMKPEQPPAGLNWDMWLGPRALRPYQFNIAPYRFRWWSDYSTQMGNWGVHYMDVIRWLMNEKAPVAVSAIGGKYILDDDRTIPDTMEVIFEFKSGSIIKFSIYEGTSGTGITGGEVELNGTKATLVANENGYEIKPARPGQFQNWKKQADPEKYEAEKNPAPQNSGFREDSTSRLIRNFLNCVKSKEQPWCPLEEGHRSTSFAHLANIALAVGQRLTWDADAEKFINSEKANQLLHYEYRKPWKLI